MFWFLEKQCPIYESCEFSEPSDEWAIAKQACRDQGVFSFLFSANKGIIKSDQDFFYNDQQISTVEANRQGSTKHRDACSNSKD